MDIQTQTKIGEVYRTIKEIAEATTPDLTVRQLLVLLDVGRAGELSQQTIAERQDLVKSTTSRIVQFLAGSSSGVKMDGMGMLEVRMDPVDMRGRIVSLSSDGEKCLARAVREGAGRQK